MTAIATRGTSFGRYRLLERLGEGGMAVVYRAVLDGPDRFERSVVVKRIRPSRSDDVEFQRMFAHEARVCGLLHHPAIVQVHEFGQIDGEAYLVMEYVEGFDLSWIMGTCAREQTLVPIEVTCHVMLELAAAIGYAHALRGEDGKPLGLVHRDISPSNIVLTPHGGVKLLDFGIAKLSASFDAAEQTLSGTLKGKVSYMSPEQADGRPLDGRSDLFSLGIVFHEMLTRRRLFRTRDDLETLRRIREAQVAPPSTFRPEIDAELDAIVLRLLAREPDARFPTAEALVEALQPIAHWLHADSRRTASFLRAMKPRPLSDGTLDASDPAVGATMPEPGRRRARGTRVSRVTRWSLPLVVFAAAIWVGWRRPWRHIASLGASRVHVESLRPAPAIPSPPTPTPPLPPSVSSPEVRLKVVAPADATVFLDDVVQGHGDLELRLPSRPATRALRVELVGRRAFARELAGDRDVVVEASLPPKPPRRRDDGDGIKDPFAR